MQKIKKSFQYALLTLVTMFSFSIATPVAATANAACTERVFTFPTWYAGVVDGSCNLKIRQLNDFWVIALNFVEILLQIVAYVAAGFLVWGGFKYIKSEGDPGKISEAKMAIINAIIGLVIALASVAIVDFVQGGIIQS
jgi:hypothetical protein